MESYVFSKCYEGCKGKLLLISDLTNGYDNCKTIESLKALIVEIREIAINELQKDK